MRILLVSQEYPPETGHGGIATQAATKARELVRLGHAVTVLSHSPDDRRHDVVRDGIRVLRIPGPDSRLTINTEPARWVTWSNEVAVAIDHLAAELDLVEVADWAAEGFVHLLNRSGSAPAVVLHLHGSVALLSDAVGWPEPDGELRRVGTMMEGTCVRLADAVYASSALSADACAATYGRPRDEIPVLHAGLDLDVLRPTGALVNEPVVGFVGRVGPAKGADVLLAAAVRLAPRVPGLRLHLWGPSVDGAAERLQDEAAAAGWPDLVRLEGASRREDLPAHLATVRILAAPSRFEAGPGFVVLEAMACGLPVVASGGRGLEDTVVDGGTGLLVPPGDVAALEAALATLLADPGRAREMGRQGRAHVEAHADARSCVAEIAAFYASVLG